MDRRGRPRRARSTPVRASPSDARSLLFIILIPCPPGRSGITLSTAGELLHKFSQKSDEWFRLSSNRAMLLFPLTWIGLSVVLDFGVGRGRGAFFDALAGGRPSRFLRVRQVRPGQGAALLYHARCFFSAAGRAPRHPRRDHRVGNEAGASSGVTPSKILEGYCTTGCSTLLLGILFS